jgi:cell division protein FtsW (lipid II flippase)
VLAQVIYRIFDISAPALAEMMVRGEKELLCRRFRQIVVLSVNLAVVAGAMFALCNSTSVTRWIDALSVQTVQPDEFVIVDPNRP